MKNQNFGENRDLLKFDLVNEVLKSGLIEQFVYVPMLTPDEAGKESENICRNESTGGRGNARLLDFLDLCVVNEKRQVGQLENYFKGEGFQAAVYRPGQFLTAENRKAYFEELRQVLPPKALILLDPDKGLEENDKNPSNLMYSEIRDIYNCVDDESILMFTQRFPYEMYREYLDMRTAEIKSEIPFSQPISLDDLDSILFFLPRTPGTLNGLVTVLKGYIEKYAEKAE